MSRCDTASTGGAGAAGAGNRSSFSFRAVGDGRVFISWRGREAACLKGREAEKFLAQVEGAAPEAQQLAMARATGNFKRGNERRDG